MINIESATLNEMHEMLSTNYNNLLSSGEIYILERKINEITIVNKEEKYMVIKPKEALHDILRSMQKANNHSFDKFIIIPNLDLNHPDKFRKNIIEAARKLRDEENE